MKRMTERKKQGKREKIERKIERKKIPKTSGINSQIGQELTITGQCLNKLENAKDK
jgi:hypothetical protein